MSLPLLDIMFCMVLVTLAWSAMRARDIFSGIVLFIVFGLLMALAWARLNASDLALTEAALGAGLVGALFLAVQHRVASAAGDPGAPGRFRGPRLLILPVLAPVLYATCADWVQTGGTPEGGGLTHAAYAAMPTSGVKNVVTATLLNYRAYDTLLELCVILLVALAVFALVPPRRDPVPVPAPDPVLAAYARGIGPVVLMVAGYVLWAGGHRAGGAFQAGSILAGVGVLLLLTFGPGRLQGKGGRLRLAAVAGFISFAVLGLALPARGLPPLTWPPALAKAAILTIETVATLSIATALVFLFAACAGHLPPGLATDEASGEPEP